MGVDAGFSLKVKSLRNTATYQHIKFHPPHPPLPLYHCGGVNLSVRLRVNRLSFKKNYKNNKNKQIIRG